MLYSLTTTVKLSLRNLRTNTLRTFLTLLGIIIAVIAIFLIITIGENVRLFIVGQVESFGTDYVQVETKVPQADQFSRDNIGGRVGTKITTMTLDDADALRHLPNVAAIAPGIVAQERISAGTQTKTVLIFGAGHEQFLVDAQMDIARGAFFSVEDERRTARVVVLGSAVADEFFGGRDAVGETVKIGGKNYRITGVLAERGAVGPMSFDDFIYVPITTTQKVLLGVDHIDWMTIKARDASQLRRTADDIRQIMRMRHKITDPIDEDFTVDTPDQIIGQIDTIFSVINLLLLALASISLIVGGVGIMNVMLVAVEERINEIGLRKAHGARARDIVQQFLVEAVITSLIGAVIGTALGLVLALAGFVLAAKSGFPLAGVVPMSASLIALVFALLAGTVFGLIPARKAAAISPIDAMRG